jgi:uncharacterized protein (TIGR02594 family)
MPDEQQYRVTATALNVRKGPSVKEEVVGYLHKGDIVTRLDVSGDGYWFKIEKESLRGWSAQKYLELVVPPVPPEKYPWMPIALAEVGVKEFYGNGDNPRIVEYLQSTMLESPWNANDETPWCSAFVNWCVERAGYEGTDSAWARSWFCWGKFIESPERGCIAVFKRNNDPYCGHVGFFIEENQNGISVLGGNQSNSVKTSWYSRDDLLGFRIPG